MTETKNGNGIKYTKNVMLTIAGVLIVGMFSIIFYNLILDPIKANTKEINDVKLKYAEDVGEINGAIKNLEQGQSAILKALGVKETFIQSVNPNPPRQSE